MSNTSGVFDSGNTTTTGADESRPRSDLEIYACGLMLLVYGSAGLVIFSVSISAMVKQSTKMIGFRFLVSNAFGDALLLVQFAVWPGIVILRQRNIFPDSWRYVLHVYLDFTWYVVIYHYTIIAWSRMYALWRPMSFRSQSVRTSVTICVVVGWIIPFVQSVVSHLIPDFSYMYLSPSAFGYVFVDYVAYTEGWTFLYYTIFNTTLNTILPVVCYAITIYFLIRMRVQMQNTTAPTGADDRRERKRMGVEVRLLIPCMINNVVSLLGQFTINNPKVSMDWIAFFVLVVFTTKSFINSLLYVGFSSVLRGEVVRIVTRGTLGGGDTSMAPTSKAPNTGGGGAVAMPPLPPLQTTQKRLSVAYEKQA